MVIAIGPAITKESINALANLFILELIRFVLAKSQANLINHIYSNITFDRFFL